MSLWRPNSWNELLTKPVKDDAIYKLRNSEKRNISGTFAVRVQFLNTFQWIHSLKILPHLGNTFSYNHRDISSRETHNRLSTFDVYNRSSLMHDAHLFLQPQFVPHGGLPQLRKVPLRHTWHRTLCGNYKGHPRWATVNTHVFHYCYFCPILTKHEYGQKYLAQIPNTKFQENLPVEASRVHADGQTWRK